MTPTKDVAVDQDRHPNFRDTDGRLFLVRCFKCDPGLGKENWAFYVYRGECTWCGWVEADEVKVKEGK